MVLWYNDTIWYCDHRRIQVTSEGILVWNGQGLIPWAKCSANSVIFNATQLWEDFFLTRNQGKGNCLQLESEYILSIITITPENR